MTWKVLCDGYKYPPNSIPSLFILNNGTIHINFTKENYRLKIFLRIKSCLLNDFLWIFDALSWSVRKTQIYFLTEIKRNSVNIFVYKHAKIRCRFNFNFYRNFTKLPNFISLLISRNESLEEIRTLLLKEGIESNPGPEIESYKSITINCNGLTSDQRLLQAIGRIKKNIKSSNAIIFLQETHNANLILLENIWKGNVHKHILV